MVWKVSRNPATPRAENGARAPRGAPTLIARGHEHASRCGPGRASRDRGRHQSVPAVGQGRILLRQSTQPVLAGPERVAAGRCAAGARTRRRHGARRALRDRLHRHRQAPHRRQWRASTPRVFGKARRGSRLSSSGSSPVSCGSRARWDGEPSPGMRDGVCPERRSGVRRNGGLATPASSSLRIRARRMPPFRCGCLWGGLMCWRISCLLGGEGGAEGYEVDSMSASSRLRTTRWTQSKRPASPPAMSTRELLARSPTANQLNVTSRWTCLHTSKYTCITTP